MSSELSESYISANERYPERSLQFDFVRATENAALSAIDWLGRGDKESADAAASDAIRGTLEQSDFCGEVVIGEGIKDNAPGIFLGEKIGSWKFPSARFNIAVDPIDGTTNISKGLPNSISVLAAAHVPHGAEAAMVNIPTFYSEKLAYGPEVVVAMEKNPELRFTLDTPVKDILERVAAALGKQVRQVYAVVLDRPRHAKLIADIRAAGAALRLISDGDVTAAVSPSLHDTGMDLYLGIGGSPEGVLTAAGVLALGGDQQLRMWPRDDAERAEIKSTCPNADVRRIFYAKDLITSPSAIFCATGISDSPLLPGVRLIGRKVITHSILMRSQSRSVRYIKTVHDLDFKTIRRSPNRKDHYV
ncbi:MAG: glpX [Verrucomicrobia bacterium]|nr:glpX [Verrucomicrobiota bacterium]